MAGRREFGILVPSSRLSGCIRVQEKRGFSGFSLKDGEVG
ncbi:hypothetical protein HMPREF0080_01921 [Anaeroglobus geminatus F0357]|uniref:Uncharacterized protein n=1 Tax=Anaeroglobus geminatus F0357 TaxID=861450 RepID=G9YJR7_9FIRM|nr:hypothetical protein HMPREF0080_01921 [Anaeroglobus geminatus F0357]